MNVSLTPELEGLLNRKVESGQYTSASEVISEALALLEDRDRLLKTSVREKIAAGMTSLKAGRGADGDAFMAQMDDELSALEQQDR